MKKFFLTLLILLALVVAIPFTSIGQNSIIIPIANSILKDKVKNHKIQIKELKPSFDSFEGRVVVDDSIDIFLTGPVDWLSQKFNFKYMVNSKEFQLDDLKLPLNMDIKGTITGKPDDIAVYGIGRAFEAAVKYNLKVVKNQINSIQAIIKDANLKQILTLAKQPPYADGKVSIKANVPKFDLQNPQGSAKVDIKRGVLNRALIAKMFKIDLPRDDFGLDGKFKIKNKVITGESLLYSSLVNVELFNLISTVDFNKIKSDFKVNIPNLALLQKLAKQPIRGKIDIDGKAFIDRKNSVTQILASTKSLGGNSKIFYNTDSIKARLINIDLKKVNYLSGTPLIVKNGKATIKADIKSLKSINGAYSIKANGELNRKALKKEYKIDPITERFSLASAGSIKKGLLESKTVLKSPLVSANLTKTKYKIDNGSIDTNFYLRVAELSKLESIIGTKLKGAFATAGKATIKSKTEVRVIGSSKSLGGVLKYDYKGKNLSLKLKSVDGVKLLRLLAQKAYLKSSLISGSINLTDTKNLSGVFNISSSGKLNQAVIKKENRVNIGSNLPYKLLFKGNIISNKLSSKVDLSTPLATIKVKPFNYDLKAKKMIGEYSLNIPSLLKLEPILENRYYGSLAMSGQFWMDKLFHITGAGKKWQGSFNFRLDDKNLVANVKKAQMVDIFKTLGYQPLLIGKADASLKYNLDSQNGVAKITLDRSKLVRNSLVKVMDLVIHKDLTKEIFNSTILTSKLSKTLINFDFDMKSNKHRVLINNGKIDRKRSRIDAVVSFFDGPKEYKAKLKGPLKRPKLIPMVTSALRNRAIKEAKHLLKKNGIKVDKIENKVKRKIDKVIPKDLQKNLLKGLF